MNVDVGSFCFLRDNYFHDFPDVNLMQNKETISGQAHNRPCFFAFKDKDTQIHWLIPVSSQVEKYKKIYNKNMAKYKNCDTIVFGELANKETVFLIQNMCPATPIYIKNEYLDKNEQPIRIPNHIATNLIQKARRVLALQRQGVKLIFPDVLSIERKLLNAEDCGLCAHTAQT
ncbi:MAG: hypothetical protein FWB93_01255 [Oscillospiraceae bacterium]|nr:hypothetical protein [Oscillospiraceae bacterium]